MMGEDALSSIVGILQAIGELAREKSTNADLHTLLGDIRAEQTKLLGIQKEEVTLAKPVVGLTEEAAGARLGLRSCILDVRQKLRDLLRKLNSRGFDETGLGGFETLPLRPRRKTDAETLRECQKDLKAARTRAERCQAFNVAHRSWEKKRPSHFVEVRKFYEILSRLGDAEKKVVILCGMFGMGKSALALEVASTLSRGFDYPGGVHFIVFGQEMRSGPQTDEKICSELLHVVEFLDKRGLKRVDYSLTPSVKKARIREILETMVSVYRCLFVLDDVSDPGIVKDFVFQNHLGNVLVTTRSVEGYRHPTRFDIQPSDYKETKLDQLIFTKHAGIPPEVSTNLQASASRILEKCHGCPLALTIMGNAIRGKTEPDEWLRVAQSFSFHAQHSLPGDGYASTMFEGVRSSIDACSFTSVMPLQAIGLFRASTEIPDGCMRMAWIIQKRIHSFEADTKALTCAHLLEETEKHREIFYLLHPIVSEYLIENLHLKKGINTLRDSQLHSLDSCGDVANSIHLFCAFLLTYGHRSSASESAEVLFEELGPGFSCDIMEGVVHEVKDLASKLSTKTDELPALKDRVIAATLSSWGLAKVIQTSERQGLSDLELARKLQPDNAITLRNLGVAHFILGDYDAAVANLTSANKLQPDDHLTLRFLTNATMGTSDWGNVQPELEMAENTGRTDIFLSVQGLHKWKEGSLNSALRDLEECRNRNPYIRSIMGAIKMELGNLRDAQADLEKALAVEDAAFTRCMRGLISLGNGEYGAAKEDLDRALELEPNTALFLSVRGEVNRMLEKYENAANDLELAVTLLQVPDNFTLRSLINVKWMQGKFEEAIHLAKSMAPSQERQSSVLKSSSR